MIPRTSLGFPSWCPESTRPTDSYFQGISCENLMMYGKLCQHTRVVLYMYSRSGLVYFNMLYIDLFDIIVFETHDNSCLQYFQFRHKYLLNKNSENTDCYIKYNHARCWYTLMNQKILLDHNSYTAKAGVFYLKKIE